MLFIPKLISGHENIVLILLRAHADIDALDADSWTPLHYTAFAGK